MSIGKWRPQQSWRAVMLIVGVALAMGACAEGDGVDSNGDQAETAVGGEVVVDWYPGLLGANLERAFADTYEGGAEVNILGNWDNPRFTEMQANAANPNVDVAMFISPLMPIVLGSGLTEPLDSSGVPNLEHVDPDVRTGDDSHVPVTYGSWGIMYNVEEVSEPITSWADLLRDDLSGRVTSPNITYNSSLYTLDALARLGGGSLQDAEHGYELYREIRENGPGLWDAESTAVGWMKTGEVWATPFFSGNVLQLEADPDVPELAFVVPEEGAYYVPFNVTKASGGPNPDAADDFINHMLSEEAQHAWTLIGRARPVNENVALPSEIDETVPHVTDLIHLDWEYFAENRDEIVNRFNDTVN